MIGQIAVAEKIERDRDHSSAAPHDWDRERSGHYRRHGCQRAIAKKDQRQEGRLYHRALGQSGNAARGRQAVRCRAENQRFQGYGHNRREAVDGDHGRIGPPQITLVHDVTWLQQRHGWPALSGVVVVDSTRETASKTDQETRFYITSLTLPAATVGPMIRDHWAIENSLHWVMDMSSATTNAGCAPITRPPISSQSSIRPII